MSDAFISPGPLTSSINFFGSLDELLRAKDLTFNTMSVTSSLTPLIEVNSVSYTHLTLPTTVSV